MDELKHHGIKGMHWGKHKSPEKQDAKWYKQNKTKHYMDAHNKSIGEMNKFINKLNSEFNNGHGLNTNDHPDNWNAKTKLYVKTYDTNYQKALNKHLHTIISPSGNYHLSASVKNGEVAIIAKKKNNN